MHNSRIYCSIILGSLPPFPLARWSLTLPMRFRAPNARLVPSFYLFQLFLFKEHVFNFNYVSSSSFLTSNMKNLTSYICTDYTYFHLVFFVTFFFVNFISVPFFL